MPAPLVVMGVSGAGKSVIGELLARELGCPFAEGDDFHSASNVAKMSQGVALTDEDRAPWLDALAAWLTEHADGGVLTCSALRRDYRDTLRAAAPGLSFVHLTGAAELIAARLQRRRGHFMPATLLRSQLATLEPLDADESGVVLDIAEPPERLVIEAIDRLR